MSRLPLPAAAALLTMGRSEAFRVELAPASFPLGGCGQLRLTPAGVSR